jgi:hypothetical protein
MHVSKKILKRIEKERLEHKARLRTIQKEYNKQESEEKKAYQSMCTFLQAQVSTSFHKYLSDNKYKLIVHIGDKFNPIELPFLSKQALDKFDIIPRSGASIHMVGPDLNKRIMIWDSTDPVSGKKYKGKCWFFETKELQNELRYLLNEFE